MGTIDDFVNSLKEKLENQKLSPEQCLLIEDLIERYEQYALEIKDSVGLENHLDK